LEEIFLSFGQIGGVNKLSTKYDLDGGNLTLFDATTGRELSNMNNVHLDSCEVEKGTQLGNWIRRNASITMEFTTEEAVGLAAVWDSICI
jgi:hypothetical protein